MSLKAEKRPLNRRNSKDTVPNDTHDLSGVMKQYLGQNLLEGASAPRACPGRHRETWPRSTQKGFRGRLHRSRIVPQTPARPDAIIWRVQKT
jgi:hypothetical protein